MARRATLLSMFEAGHRYKLGQVTESVQLLIAVLRDNPLPVPAYAQLGDILRQQRDMPRAWRSWEASRRIWSGSPPARELTRRAAQLMEDYPEYF